MPLSHPDLEQRCYELIDRLFARYKWELLDREEFLRRTIAAYNDNPNADLAYLTFGVYNQALYTACSGAEGPLRWEQGYKEVFEMLCARAQRTYPEVWEDVVQSAIELTCSRFDRCKVPQAFFQFAWGQVQNAARSHYRYSRRKDNRSDLSLERSVNEDQSPLIESIPDSSPAIIETIMREELSNEVQAALEEFAEAHPRAQNQLAAVQLKHLFDQDDETISKVLGVSVQQVQVLRSRGVAKLRNDPALRKLFGEPDE